MKALTVVGLVVLALGIISFFVPFPHSEHHGVRVGDAHVGITTRDDQKAPPIVSIVLVIVGGRFDDCWGEELAAVPRRREVYFAVALSKAVSSFVTNGDSPCCSPLRLIMRQRY